MEKSNEVDSHSDWKIEDSAGDEQIEKEERRQIKWRRRSRRNSYHKP